MNLIIFILCLLYLNNASNIYYEQSPWLLISDNISTNDKNIGLILNPSINKTYVVWSENNDIKNDIWESYLPYNYNDKYIVQANKLNINNNIRDPILEYNPLVYINNNKINPSILVYIENNKIHILLSDNFNNEWNEVYVKEYNNIYNIEEPTIMPDYEIKNTGINTSTSRNWLLCYVLKSTSESNIECLHSLDGKIWNNIDNFPYNNCTEPLLYSTYTNKWRILTICNISTHIYKAHVELDMYKNTWSTHSEYREFEFMLKNKIGYNYDNVTDTTIISANHEGITQTNDATLIFELTHFIPNSARDIVHYHKSNKWLFTSSDINLINNENMGVHLYYYDDITQKSITLGKIFNENIDDIEIYNGFNGYYPILIRLNNMLLYSVLYFNDTNIDIFDIYQKYNININNKSILNKDSIIDVDQVYICSNETTVIDMDNIKLLNINLDIRCNVNIVNNIYLYNTSTIKISNNLNINGNLILDNYSDQYHESIFNFNTLDNIFNNINNTNSCYNITYNTFNINLNNNQCNNNEDNDGSNKGEDNNKNIETTSLIIIIVSCLVVILAIITGVILIIKKKKIKNNIIYE